MFTLLVGIAGFFRKDEIRNEALRDASIFSDHMSVYVPQHKNDHRRDSHISLLARSGKVTCPVAVTERLIKLLPQSFSAFPLVGRIVKAKSNEHSHPSLGVSISTLRKEFKKHIKPFVRDIPNYYPTALRRVQITPKTSTNITRYLYSRGPA